MEEKQLLQRIAKLESLCDQLQSERNTIDMLLKELGFEEGLKTLKEAAIELLDKRQPPPME
jgi:recombinational DNA repair protein (RecF pathway)